MSVALPTEQQIADLHEHLLARHGGLPGSRAGTSLGSVLGRIHMNLAYQFEDPTVQQVAAFAVYAFAVGHPFNDANKRTALALGDLILLMNDENVIAGEHGIELADRVIELAAGNIGQDRFIETYVAMLEKNPIGATLAVARSRGAVSLDRDGTSRPLRPVFSCADFAVPGGCQ